MNLVLRTCLITSTLLASAPTTWAGICDISWDGGNVAALARGRSLSDPIRLNGGNRQVIDQVTARQVLAFVEAKDAIGSKIGRNDKLLICSSNDPNAFATHTEGGDVMGVTVGMLKLLNGDRDAAAMVVGHEFAHHQKNHMDSAQARQAVIGLLGLIAGTALEYQMARRSGGGTGLGYDIANVGGALVSRKFDRDQEREADELGFQHLVAAGFNANGAVRLADRMRGMGNTTGLFFDSHPGWGERAAAYREYIARSPAAQAIIARTGDSTRLAATGGMSTELASIVPAYVSTDAERSYNDALTAYRNKDTATGLVHLRAAADAGHAKSQLMLANLYVRGTSGVAKNEIEAVRLFKTAAEHDEPDAVNNLGVAYSVGLGGLTKSPAQALAFFQHAVDLGNGRSAKNIGDMYERGTEVTPKDLQQALVFYRKSEEMGFPDGIAAVGVYYERGLGGLERDVHKAIEQYERATLRNSNLARYRLGLLLVSGRDGTAQDEPRGVTLLRLAAEAGYAPAQNEIGAYYGAGRHGMPKDDTQAVDWYRKGAEQSNAMAEANLGFMHLQGRGGLGKNPTEAGRWFSRSSQHGAPNGDHGLGLLYEFGEGGYPKSRERAIELYRQAAAKGYQPAADRLAKLSAN